VNSRNHTEGAVTRNDGSPRSFASGLRLSPVQTQSSPAATIVAMAGYNAIMKISSARLDLQNGRLDSAFLRGYGETIVGGQRRDGAQDVRRRAGKS
jgi:hypothetical protein